MTVRHRGFCSAVRTGDLADAFIGRDLRLIDVVALSPERLRMFSSDPLPEYALVLNCPMKERWASLQKT